MSGGNLMHTLWQRWRSLRRDEASWFALLGLALGVVTVSATLELRPSAPAATSLPPELLAPLLFSALLMGLWLPMERGPVAGLTRLQRLTLVCLAGVPLAIVAMGAMLGSLGWPAMTDILFNPSQFPASEHSWRWGRLLGDVLTLMWGGALTAVRLDVTAPPVQLACRGALEIGAPQDAISD